MFCFTLSQAAWLGSAPASSSTLAIPQSPELADCISAVTPASVVAWFGSAPRLSSVVAMATCPGFLTDATSINGDLGRKMKKAW